MPADEKSAVNVIDSDGLTPIHRCCRVDDYVKLSQLVSAGGDIYASDPLGQTPLHIAVINNSVECIVFLLRRKNFDVEIKDKSGCTALHVAASHGRARCALMLLNGGAQVNSLDNSGETPLHKAAAAGEVDSARVLLQGQAVPNIRDTLGDTAFHRAIATGHVAAAEDLLHYGADPKITNNVGNSVAHTAAGIGDLAALKFVLDKGVSLTDVNNFKETVMHAAASKGQHNIVTWLLDSGFPTDSRDSSGATALHKAIAAGYLDVVQLLLKRAKSTQLMDGAMHVASAKGDLHVMDMLLAYGADLEGRDTIGCTPLHRAVEYSQWGSVSFLLQRGASVETIDHRGQTLLTKVLVAHPDLGWLTDLGVELIISSVASIPRDIGTVVSALHAQLAKAAQDSKTKQSELDRLQTSLADLQKYAKLKEAEIDRLRSRENDRLAEIRKLTNEMEKVRKENSDLHQQLGETSELVLQMEIKHSAENAVNGVTFVRTIPKGVSKTAIATPQKNEDSWTDYQQAILYDTRSGKFSGQGARLKASPFPERSRTPGPTPKTDVTISPPKSAPHLRSSQTLGKSRSSSAVGSRANVFQRASTALEGEYRYPSAWGTPGDTRTPSPNMSRRGSLTKDTDKLPNFTRKLSARDPLPYAKSPQKTSSRSDLVPPLIRGPHVEIQLPEGQPSSIFGKVLPLQASHRSAQASNQPPTMLTPMMHSQLPTISPSMTTGSLDMTPLSKPVTTLSVPDQESGSVQSSTAGRLRSFSQAISPFMSAIRNRATSFVSDSPNLDSMVSKRSDSVGSSADNSFTL